MLKEFVEVKLKQVKQHRTKGEDLYLPSGVGVTPGAPAVVLKPQARFWLCSRWWKLAEFIGLVEMRGFGRVGVEANVLTESQNIHKNKSHSVLSLLCGFLVNQRRKREWEEGSEKIFRTQSKSNPTPPGQYLSCKTFVSSGTRRKPFQTLFSQNRSALAVPKAGTRKDVRTESEQGGGTAATPAQRAGFVSRP